MHTKTLLGETLVRHNKIAVGYYVDFSGAFLNKTLMPIVQYQVFNQTAADKDFAISGLSAGLLWKAAFGMDLAFTYNTLTTEAELIVTGDDDSVASSMVLNFEYTINSFRPYFTWIADVADENADDAKVTTTTLTSVFFTTSTTKLLYKLTTTCLSLTLTTLTQLLSGQSVLTQSLCNQNLTS